MEEISKYLLFDNDEYLRIIFIVALKPPGDVSALQRYIWSEKIPIIFVYCRMDWLIEMSPTNKTVLLKVTWYTCCYLNENVRPVMK